MNRLTLADIRADARRTRSWPLEIAHLLWAGVVWLAIWRLQSPDLVGMSRTLWTLLPFPFFVLGFWASEAREKRMDEFELAVERAAGSLAFRFTLFWLFALFLLNASIGLPATIPMPFGLHSSDVGWADAAFVPVPFYVFSQAWVRKYRFGFEGKRK
ncbi:MAG: hypothetical protein ABIZ70_12210 [Gemmatimonadales bacterium]